MLAKKYFFAFFRFFLPLLGKKMYITINEALTQLFQKLARIEKTESGNWKPHNIISRAWNASDSNHEQSTKVAYAR